MTPLIYLGVIIGIPLILAILFRVSAVFLFLSVMVGNLLAVHLSDDASLALSMAVRVQNLALLTKFGLLLLPVLLTTLFMRKTIPAAKLVLHAVPLVAVSLCLGVLVIPLLDGSLQEQIFALPYASNLKNAQDVVLGATAVLILLLMWLTERGGSGKGHKR